MNNKSYQYELDAFFQPINHLEIAERVLYKGNLSKARAKLKHEAFIEFNDHIVRYFYQHFPFVTWHGFTLFAVDGSTLRIPDEKDTTELFGAWNSNKGKKPCPKARASQMFDVLNKVTIDAIISPKSDGERELAAIHFLKLQPNDLILLDRGYPAFWLFKLAMASDAQFCARISYKKWKVVKKFYESGNKEQIVKIKASALSNQMQLVVCLQAHGLFLRKTPLDPPRAGITTKTDFPFIIKSLLSSSRPCDTQPTDLHQSRTFH